MLKQRQWFPVTAVIFRTEEVLIYSRGYFRVWDWGMVRPFGVFLVREEGERDV